MHTLSFNTFYVKAFAVQKKLLRSFKYWSMVCNTRTTFLLAVLCTGFQSFVTKTFWYVASELAHIFLNLIFTAWKAVSTNELSPCSGGSQKVFIKLHFRKIVLNRSLICKALFIHHEIFQYSISHSTFSLHGRYVRHGLSRLQERKSLTHYFVMNNARYISIFFH